MSKNMLIDSAHLEEIRVAIVDGDKLDRFDTETASRTQTRGNIYLAKVVRVEPSLQAAFVDYGEERHGFLSFSEIHHDYFQIPVGDREELENRVQNAVAAQVGNDVAGEESDSVDDAKEIARIRYQFYKRYKIQEVIKKRQIMLVQVTKEERGNKGAAITTYISLAGKYCVLMPNMAKGSGVSRKIVNGEDRAKLKKIVADLHVENGSVVIRTAGVDHSKVEIKKDFDYLKKLWDEIRENTLKATAPCLIYEEASIIKRSIRDFYSRDIDSIIVEGDEGFKIAKNFVKKLMPSHVKKVKQYDDKKIPLFSKFKINDQVYQIYSSRVDLPSGGYLIISPTEALISIDVNSGRSTRERNISGTALKTNLEAAAEIARQCKLRDLAGLIVVDFIDMDEKRNNIQVEKCIREALREDKAKIQLGVISSFGLLEFSRQRLRPSIADSNMIPCPHCAGSGSIWSNESIALQILRKVEETSATQDFGEVIVTLSVQVAMYILNNKRAFILHIEQRSGAIIRFNIDNSIPIDGFKIETVVKQSVEHDESTATDAVAKAANGSEIAGTRTRDSIRNHEPATRTMPRTDQNETESAADLQSQAGELMGNIPKSKSRRRRNRRRRDDAAFIHEKTSPQELDGADQPQSGMLFQDMSHTGSGNVENADGGAAENIGHVVTTSAKSDAVQEEIVFSNDSASTTENSPPLIAAGDVKRRRQRRRRKPRYSDEATSPNAEQPAAIVEDITPTTTVFSLDIKKGHDKNFGSRKNRGVRSAINHSADNSSDDFDNAAAKSSSSKNTAPNVVRRDDEVSGLQKNNPSEPSPVVSEKLFSNTEVLEEFTNNNKQFIDLVKTYKMAENLMETSLLQNNVFDIPANKKKKNGWWQKLLKKTNAEKDSGNFGK